MLVETLAQPVNRVGVLAEAASTASSATVVSRSFSSAVSSRAWLLGTGWGTSTP